MNVLLVQCKQTQPDCWDMSQQPKIDARLWVYPVCYLSRQTHFSLVIHIMLRSKQPVTIVKKSNSLEVGLVEALKS